MIDELFDRSYQEARTELSHVVICALAALGRAARWPPRMISSRTRLDQENFDGTAIPGNCRVCAAIDRR